MWEPFLTRGEVKESDWEKTRDEISGNRWLSVIDRFPSIFFILVVAIFFGIVATASTKLKTLTCSLEWLCSSPGDAIDDALAIINGTGDER
jgi:hypothetical protein